MVKGLPKSAWMPIFVTLSARTSAGAVQEQIEGRLDKRRKGVLGPPPSQKCLIFVDDLNMPKLDPYETAMPISLIRQHLGWGHWFDRQKLTQKNIHNTQ